MDRARASPVPRRCVRVCRAPVFVRGRGGGAWEGRGSSLRIRVFDADANLIREAYQGLEVIHTFRLMRRDYSRGLYWYTYTVRDDLFEDRDILEDAARVTLRDVLP